MRDRAGRVILWDFDGTLASREGPWSSTLAKALQSIAPELHVSAAEFGDDISVSFPWFAPDVIRVTRSASAWWEAQHSLFLRAYLDAGVRPATAERAVAAIPGEYYRPTAWSLAGDALSVLRMTAGSGYRNAILSNHAPELPHLVTDLGLDPLIDVTITGASVGAEKPDPRIFAYAIEVTDAGDDVWMVGDNPIADVAGAEAVGIRAIQVSVDFSLSQAAAQIVRGGGGPR